MRRCFIAIGSNLGRSLHTLRGAADALEDADCVSLRRSPIYRSAAVGPASQNDYLNAVLELHTALDPLPLLDKLQALEHAAGRIRTVHWGPRTLDLDLLMAGDESLDHQRLQLPHPRMTERDFVLRPLADLLGPDWRLPDGRTLTDQLTRCADNNLRETGFNWGESAAPQNARRA